MAQERGDYPANLRIDYPATSDRLTTFFRLLTAMPILVILSLLASADISADSSQETHYVYHSIGFVVAPTALMILFRQKYPRWWFDWNVALTQFSMRVFSYVLLLRDEYPSTDQEQAVHVEILYPDVGRDLHRGLPLIKWLLALPHYSVLSVLYIGAVLCTIIAWFAILLMGSYPRSLFDFVVGVMRWSLRVGAYAFLLTTDQYPPFRLAE